MKDARYEVSDALKLRGGLAAIAVAILLGAVAGVSSASQWNDGSQPQTWNWPEIAENVTYVSSINLVNNCNVQRQVGIRVSSTHLEELSVRFNGRREFDGFWLFDVAANSQLSFSFQFNFQPLPGSDDPDATGDGTYSLGTIRITHLGIEECVARQDVYNWTTDGIR